MAGTDLQDCSSSSAIGSSISMAPGVHP
jgi:hypothetical protein